MVEADGHNYDDLYCVLKSAPQAPGKPTCIIANTVKGRGVSFMENSSKWHHRVPSDEELAAALDELMKDEL